MTEHIDRLNTALHGRYTIQRELGSGGMATVYLAEDLKHRRQVAIKVLRPELAASLGVERFVREIEIAANLTHPHILPLHDSGEADGFLSYVMPFDQGGGGAPWNEPVRLADFGCGYPDWAPDGSGVLCDAGGEMVLVSREGAVLSRYDPSTAGLQPQSLSDLQFSPDGSRIYFLATDSDGSEGVWWIPTNGGDATKVVAFDDPSLTMPGGLTVGRENLYITVAQYESDVYAMDLEW